MKPFGLYIHIPFCLEKCAYCDFLSFPTDEATRQKYVDSLCYEIQAYGAVQKATIGTIYLGGGTPTTLTSKQLKQIFDCIYSYLSIEKHCEVTIEINPKTLDADKIDYLSKSPVNRVSIGLQSTFEKHLTRLSRKHTYEDFLMTYEGVKAAGITNINIDVMFGLPDQTMEEWAETLEKVVALNPKHISAYGLIIEEHTPFYRLYENGKLVLPDEKLERRMYHYTNAFLRENEIYQYEISNYAKKGYESKHNTGYWTDYDYIGIGLGAASYIYGNRYKNTDDLEVYIKLSSHLDQIRTLTSEGSFKRRLEEAIFLGLRMTRGINLEDMNRIYNRPFETIYREPYEKYLKLGCLEIENGFLKLTSKGMDVSNQVFSEFLLDE